VTAKVWSNKENNPEMGKKKAKQKRTPARTKKRISAKELKTEFLDRRRAIKKRKEKTSSIQLKLGVAGATARTSQAGEKRNPENKLQYTREQLHAQTRQRQGNEWTTKREVLTHLRMLEVKQEQREKHLNGWGAAGKVHRGPGITQQKQGVREGLLLSKSKKERSVEGGQCPRPTPPSKVVKEFGSGQKGRKPGGRLQT